MPQGLRGFNLVSPVNRLRGGFVALAANVRAYVEGGFTLRTPLTSAILAVTDAIHTLRRLNDTTGAGPASGYAIISGAATTLNVDTAPVASGLSGNPISIIPSRPDASVEPWAYIGDSAPTGAVTIQTVYAISGTPTTQQCSGMIKVNSNGLAYKTGIVEPQLPPIVGTQNTITTGTDILPNTAMPWTNRSGANPLFNYGGTETATSTNPIIITTPVAGSTLSLTVTGTAQVNGATHAPSDSAPATSSYPAHFLLSGGAGQIVLGAFTDASGNVIVASSSPAQGYIYNVGAGVSLTVPPNAVQFQLGVDSAGGTFAANTTSPPGIFTVAWTLTTSATTNVVSTVGNNTIFYWDDSPTSGPVGEYLWCNQADSTAIAAGATARNVGTALATTQGNSWMLDCPWGNFVNNSPVQWTVLSSNGTVVGAAPVTTINRGGNYFGDINLILTGNLYFPVAGAYKIFLSTHDGCMIGIGGGATWDTSMISGAGTVIPGGAGFATNWKGQTETVALGLPLVPFYYANDGGGYDCATITNPADIAQAAALGKSILPTPPASCMTINIPAAGSYPVEIDFDYWYHNNRHVLLQFSPQPGEPPATIPPLPSGSRTNVIYYAKYRSSVTGAQSNPSPASIIQITPVLANTVTAPYSPDPQVDKVDYYRQDSGLANPTYISTGPNDGLGSAGYNTPIVDELTDLAVAANQIMQRDDFEPFPSIDVPRAGVIDVVGGTITRVSGDFFNIRWLPGTLMLIGSPTQLAYSLYQRPLSTTTMYLPGVPDGTGLAWNIAQPILAQQPLPYLFGPTDNINFTFGVGDPLRPGTLYWCKGSNLDSAPDTNQLDVTDPSETLVNGAMSAGRGVLFSIRRAWVIMQNFASVTATVTGESGTAWILQATSISRGLYIPRCVAIEGGGRIFFRVEDGIHLSPGGAASESITDGDLYPLFAHEGSVPQPVTRGGVTILPPDDTQPRQQTFSVVGQYLYYDYVAATSPPLRCTLVFDIEAGGWVWDAYSSAAVTCHADNDGLTQQGTLTGCADGTVREMSAASGTESVSGTVLTPAIGGRGWQVLAELTVEYFAVTPVTLGFLAADSGNGSYAPTALTLPATSGALTKLFLTPGANKYKLMQFQFSAAGPFTVNLEGFAVRVRDWGSQEALRTEQPFGSPGGLA